MGSATLPSRSSISACSASTSATWTPADYGVIGILGSLEVVAKIVFRFGLDGAFMRLFYERDGATTAQRLASTIFFFLLALNGAICQRAADRGAGAVVGRCSAAPTTPPRCG